MNITSNRTIESILDLKTGNEIIAEVFFQKNVDEIFQFRYQFETEIQNKTNRYVCYYCKQPIAIRGSKSDSKKTMHFSHLRDSDQCPLKTGHHLTKDEILRIKFNGAKESELHFNLKNLIAEFLQLDDQHIKEVLIEKVYRHKFISNNWKKPDIQCFYNDMNVVVELQLSTTFLSVINSRQEFYKEMSTFIIWVFHSFETDEDKRLFTQSDVFFNNNYNGFEFNEEAIKLSKDLNCLILKCHYQVPFIEGNALNYKWESEFVQLNQLFFDTENYSVYFYDYLATKKELEEELYATHSKLFNEIYNGNRYTIADLLINDYLATKSELKQITKLYDSEIAPYTVFNSDEEWKYNIIWVIIFIKLKNKDYIRLIIQDTHLTSIIYAILSLKLSKILGYKFKNQLQIAHTILHGRPEYSELYLKAVDKYYPNLLLIDDKNGKLSKKIEELRLKKIPQNLTNNAILEIIDSNLINSY